MINFHIKSIILGIGIGIVLTSIVSIIYLAGAEPKMLNEAEIVKLAEGYGMVKKDFTTKENLFIDEGLKEKNNKNMDEEEKEILDTKEQFPGTQAAFSHTCIKIIKGDTSESVADKLVNSGLIDDKCLFQDRIVERGLEGSIKIGQFDILINTDIDTIINILTGKK